ncbi:MAG TPA: TetR/AcrR family transcriptional regulator C-terminal domain-containing protein [Candidatus Merdivicinus faecavium]|nr:TetR/AcrR family transcriptional regulator C-terminal domain-containing protein [Candidatus Merdivicinus faecavium]
MVVSFVPVDMKAVISSAFVNMVKQKGIDKVTVKALIDACHISRQTFYYHFQDLMEVIEWSLERAAKQKLAQSLEADTPEEALAALFSSAFENRTLILRLLDSQRREQIEKLFVQAARTYLRELVRNRHCGLPLDCAGAEVALDFCAFGMVGLLFQYCAQGRTDAANLAAQICRLLPKRAEPEKNDAL